MPTPLVHFRTQNIKEMESRVTAILCDPATKCQISGVMGNLPRTTFRDIDPVKSSLRQLDEERPSRQHTAGYPILKSIADAHTLASSATPVKFAPAVP